MDFLEITQKRMPRGAVEYVIYPKFIVGKSKDLMTRGRDFYAVWNPETNLWSTEEDDVITMIDNALKKYTEDFLEKKKAMGEIPKNYYIAYMRDGDSGSIDKWHKFVQKQQAESFHDLDTKVIFANTPTKKTDYATKRLPYDMVDGDTSAWDKLVGTLYEKEERHKIEWALGSIISGDSKKLQKFFVFYGGSGTGKSTVMNVVQKMLEGYWKPFIAKDLGQANKEYALEPFKDNPLIAIEHDGDLSKIDDNSRLNSLVSHERIVVNQKYHGLYSIKPVALLFVGSNKPVKITDSKSGLMRRLIDINPSGNKVPYKEYMEIMDKIDFELGSIAKKCLEVYKDNPNYYDNYKPKQMIEETNDLYNFVEERYDEYCMEDEVGLGVAWDSYKRYCEDANVLYKLPKREFKAELKDYFKEFIDRTKDARNVYRGFRRELFEKQKVAEKVVLDKDKKSEEWDVPDWLNYLMPFGTSTDDLPALDKELKDCPAQYAVEDERNGQIRPEYKWANCKLKLADIDIDKMHYVKVPEWLIVIDFDLKNENGEKDLLLNLKAASKWPKTYAELSKSGTAVHLHYRYKGDISELSAIYSENIEVKTFPADKNSALRRKVTKYNNEEIATINSGLPKKEVKKKMLNADAVKTEAGLRKLIEKNLNKEIHGATKPSIDFIYKILEDAYNSGLEYDVSDMKHAIMYFAGNSSHQASYCMDLVAKMKFKSEEIKSVSDIGYNDKDTLVFFDIETFMNLLQVCYLPVKREQLEKWAGMKKKDFVKEIEKLRDKVIQLDNPSPEDIRRLASSMMVGYNCRRYDNHILYACMNGYSNMQMYQLSQNIINNCGNPFFGSAYDLSYTDVYDFSSKKQSLKKFEIELGMYHLENEYPWDKPLPEEHWAEVGAYCKNDVLATVATFVARYDDFVAREMLSAISGLNVNATTNQHTTRIVFGNVKNPGLVYTDLRTGKQYGPGEEFEMPVISEEEYEKIKDDWKKMPKPHGNCFPGYHLVKGKDGKLHNMYRGIDLGFGGYVHAKTGMYLNGAITEDVASEHPHSAYELNLFGTHTQQFKDLMDARIHIKHKDYDAVRKLFGGKLAPYLDDPKMAKGLAGALKIAINSVYGLTSASFMNAFRDVRNINNIVALRGALFMKTVQDAVEELGYTVIHIKTDSIKIAEPDNFIIKYVVDMGKEFGYTFEVEHIWDKLCLVNNAVYIGKHSMEDPDGPGEWEAVGTQFQIPYVFKSLFTHEKIEFEDMCETKSVKSSLYLDYDENLSKDYEAEEVEKLRRSNKKLTKREVELLEKYADISDEALKEKIARGHDYKFVGKVGLFCPMEAGVNAGKLIRSGTDRSGNETFNAATGAKWVSDGKEVNRWLESSAVKELGLENKIDRSYYRSMVDEAIASIEEFGSFEEFVA